MAAGSSAPELATVIIGVFFAKDDIGVSGVIGSGNLIFFLSLGDVIIQCMAYYSSKFISTSINLMLNYLFTFIMFNLKLLFFQLKESNSCNQLNF